MCSEIYFSASPLCVFRAAHTPIIRSTILTVSTAIGTIHSRSQIVSVTSSQRSLARTLGVFKMVYCSCLFSLYVLDIYCSVHRARLRWEEVTETIWDRLLIVPMAVDTVKIVLLMMGVCRPKHLEWTCREIKIHCTL